MTGRERLTAAYRGQKVDRLPWAPLIDWTTMRDFPAELRERGPYRLIADLGGDILRRDCALYRVVQEEVEVREQAAEDERVVERRTPVGTLREVFRRAESGQWHHVERPVKTPADCRTLAFVLEHTCYEPTPEGFEAAASEVGEAGIVAPHVPTTPVQELVQVGMGVEAFAFALQDFPVEVEHLMALMHQRNLEAYEIVAASPVEVAILCENTSTRMISPALYERYSLGHVRDFVEVMHRHGKVAVVHMCGHVRALLPLIAQTGLDGVDALTPPPTGDTTPQDAWQVIGEHLVVHGALDPTKWLTCPEAEVEGNLIGALEVVRGQRFVLCTAADGLAGVPWHRFERIADLIRRHAEPW